MDAHCCKCPVSYTHLDVYKRQILDRLPAVISAAPLSPEQVQNFNATLKEVAAVRQKVEQGGKPADLLAAYTGLIARLLEHEKRCV